MLREVNRSKPTRQFSDDYFDLYVQEKDGEVSWFQLCYDKYGNQKALTWSREGILSHTAIDEDNEHGHYPMTAILVSDRLLDHRSIFSRFEEASKEIDPKVVAAVQRVLSSYSTRM